VPQSTAHKILRILRRCKSYNYQFLQHVMVQEKEVRYTFYCDVLSNLEDDEHFTADILCSDEATYLPGHVTEHKVRISMSSGSHVVIESKIHKRKVPTSFVPNYWNLFVLLNSF
jgi:hypothetical protein